MSGEELERRSGPSPARSTKVIPGVILEIWNLDEFMLSKRKSIRNSELKAIYLSAALI